MWPPYVAGIRRAPTLAARRLPENHPPAAVSTQAKTPPAPWRNCRENSFLRHNEDILSEDTAYTFGGKEGIMAGRTECCRYEPSLEELLDDDIMAPVLRSAGFDQQGFREMMVETARRIDDRRGDVHRPSAAAERGRR
jgi:hypothetical protein